MAARRIGYFTCVEVGGRYLGALMVTDGAGIPLEFKYTEPIRPTRIQAIIYGGALERYIKIEVIRGKLTKSLATRPELIFVDTSDLSLVGLCEGVPMVALQRARIPHLDRPGDTRRPKENELIVQAQAGSDPLRLIFGAADGEQQDRVAAMLVELSGSMDPAEPLERVEQALHALLREEA